MAIFLSIFLLAGCHSTKTVEKATQLRQRILAAKGCIFETVVTADYGDVIYTFGIHCVFDGNGNLVFTVTEPHSIAGISGRITDEGGRLTFDNQLLGFPMLVDGQFSPVSAPWILMKSLRSGYIHSCGQTKQGTTVYIDDSFDDDALQVELLLDNSDRPIAADFLWKNRRILSMQIKDFAFL